MPKRGEYRGAGRRANIVKIIEKEISEEVVAGSDSQFQYNKNGKMGAVSSLTYDSNSGHLSLLDDKRFYFGTNSDAFIEYNESTDDYLVISGSSNGIVLSGSTIQIAGTLEGASPLKIGGEVQFMAQGEAAALKLGPNGEAKLFYENEGADALVISGSSGGVHLMGGCAYVHKKLGIGVSGTDITHGITLANFNTSLGQVRANAFVSYSSRRYKKDIQKLENPLKVVQSLQGVSYVWKDSGNKDYGFIAEDVGKVLPGIVQWDENGKDATSMDYNKIISFLVEAIKEQQSEIEKLNQRLDLDSKNNS